MDFLEKAFTIQQKAKATKDKKNSFGNYNYRSAEGIIEDIKPVLAETKTFILLSDEVKEVGGRVYVEATATLLDTESVSSISTKALAREAETKKGMDEAQITGAASSYARKYALSGLLLLDDNKDADTDEYQARTQEKGNSAPKKTTSKAKPAPADAQPLPAVFICGDCGNPITPYQGATPEQIAKATNKKYGKPICMDCSAKRRAEAEKPAAPIPTDEVELPFTLEE